MFTKNHFVGFLGIISILTAELLTDGSAIVMGIVYFAVYTIASTYVEGFFTPFGSISMYLAGRMSMNDALTNTLVQLLGAISAGLLFRPIKTLV